MAQKSYELECNFAENKPNPIFYFDEEGGKGSVWAKNLSIKGYPGLRFMINNSKYIIMIYSTDGIWSWDLNNEVPLNNIKFISTSVQKNKNINIIIS